MSASLAEKPTARSRVELLQRTHAERQAELARREQEVEELLERENEARLESARSAPTKRMYAVGPGGEGQPLKLRRKREKAEQAAESLALEVAALRAALDEADELRAEEERVEHQKAAARFNRDEEKEWQGFVELLPTLAERFARVVSVVSERESYFQAITDAADRETVEQLFLPRQSPFPVNLSEAVKMAMRVALAEPGDARRSPAAAGYLSEIVPNLRGAAPSARSIRGEKTGYDDGPVLGAEIGFGGGAGSLSGLSSS